MVSACGPATVVSECFNGARRCVTVWYATNSTHRVCAVYYVQYRPRRKDIAVVAVRAGYTAILLHCDHCDDVVVMRR